MRRIGGFHKPPKLLMGDNPLARLVQAVQIEKFLKESEDKRGERINRSILLVVANELKSGKKTGEYVDRLVDDTVKRLCRENGGLEVQGAQPESIRQSGGGEKKG